MRVQHASSPGHSSLLPPARPHPAVDAPQLLHADVLADTHTAKEVDPRVLCNACELVDDILGGAGAGAAQTTQRLSKLVSWLCVCRFKLPDLTLVSPWSGATPVLTRPNGDGSRSCAGTDSQSVRQQSAEAWGEGHPPTGAPNSPPSPRSRHRQTASGSAGPITDTPQGCLCLCVPHACPAHAHTPCPQCRTRPARCQQRTHSGAAAA
jgi:hypothetical protein